MNKEIDAVDMSEFKLAAEMAANRSFDKLLDDIETVDENNKAIWLEIYHNANADRQNSYLMFCELVKTCNGRSTEFAVHGRTISTFIERMSKANDQLLKLAELVGKAREESDKIDPDEMYDMLNSNEEK